VPGDPSFRQPWPLVIEWGVPRRSASPGATAVHPNGAWCVARLSLAVRSLDAPRSLYERQLGMRSKGRPKSRARRVCLTARLGRHTIQLLRRDARQGPLSELLDADGEGPSR